MQLKESILFIPRLALSFLSWLLLHTLSWLIRSALRVGRLIRRPKGSRWIGFSEVVARPIGIPFLIVTAPRWNCHATIAITDSFQVNNKISLNTESAFQSSVAFSFVLYPERGPAFSIASHLGSRGQVALTLEPGFYRIGARYYGSVEDPIFPEIFADEKVVLESVCLKGETSRYQKQLESIRDRRHWPSAGLHYYVYHMLQWRFLGEAFLKKEFVPVGNPDTDFEYGVLKAGQELTVERGEEPYPACVFVTIYNRHSFPVKWAEVTHSPHHETCLQDGFYLIRRIRMREF
jgi:hypothetical protein